jgi:hypothetical protein
MVSNPGSCAGCRASDAATRLNAIVPLDLNAASAAGGRERQAGSQTARRTAKGRPRSVAISATAPLSISSAAQPVRCHNRCFSAAVATTQVVASRVCGVNPPSRCAREGSVCNGCVPVITDSGITIEPGGRVGSRPPARPQLISAVAPSAISRSVARRAPSLVPPPIATRPSRRAMRASAARPTTIPSDAKASFSASPAFRVVSRSADRELPTPGRHPRAWVDYHWLRRDRRTDGGEWRPARDRTD